MEEAQQPGMSSQKVSVDFNPLGAAMAVKVWSLTAKFSRDRLNDSLLRIVSMGESSSATIF